VSNRVFAVGVGMTRFEKVEKGSLGIKSPGYSLEAAPT